VPEFQTRAYWEQFASDPGAAVSEFVRLVPQFKSEQEAVVTWQHLVNLGLVTGAMPTINLASSPLREGFRLVRNRRRTVIA